jgi:hypothetical protein
MPGGIVRGIELMGGVPDVDMDINKYLQYIDSN